MSAIVALLSGTLAKDPVSRTTSTGNAMATATLAVDAGGGQTAWLGLCAFGPLADELLLCTKGDAVSVRGRMELNRWTTPEGEARERWQIIAEALLPGPGKPTRARQTPRIAKRPTEAAHRFQSPPFDDTVLF